MKLRIIGSSSAYPEKDNPTSGYLVEGEGGEKVLLDIGSGVLMKLKGFMDFNEIENIFVSHMHFDHNADAGVAIYDRIVKKDLGEVGKDLVFYTPLNPGRTDVLLSPVSRVEEIRADRKVLIGNLEFSFMKTDHGENSHAIKISEGGKTLVYTADTRFFPELSEFASYSNLLLAECSMERRYDASKYGHMNTDDVAKLGNLSSPDMLVLTHTPSYTEEDRLISEVEENYPGLVFYARPGDVFEL